MKEQTWERFASLDGALDLARVYLPTQSRGPKLAPSDRCVDYLAALGEKGIYTLQRLSDTIATADLEIIGTQRGLSF